MMQRIQENLDKARNAELDVYGIDITAGLKKIGGDQTLQKKMLEKFYHDNVNIIYELKQAIQTGDISSAEFMIHSFKGAASMVVATNLSTLSGQIDQAIKQNKTVNLPTLVEKFEAALEPVLFDIKLKIIH